MDHQETTARGIDPSNPGADPGTLASSSPKVDYCPRPKRSTVVWAVGSALVASVLLIEGLSSGTTIAPGLILLLPALAFVVLFLVERKEPRLTGSEAGITTNRDADVVIPWGDVQSIRAKWVHPNPPSFRGALTFRRDGAVETVRFGRVQLEKHAAELAAFVAHASRRIAGKLLADDGTGQLGPIGYGPQRFSFRDDDREVVAEAKDVGSGEHVLGIVDEPNEVTFWARDPGKALNKLGDRVCVDIGGSHRRILRARLEDENVLPHLMNMGDCLGVRFRGVQLLETASSAREG